MTAAEGSKPTAGYEVTADGKVFSNSGWRGIACRELRQQPNESGYPSVRISIDGVRKHYAVHVLVAEKFLGPRPSDRHEVRHLDGDKNNARAENLAWGTQKDNADDRARHGRTHRMSSQRAKAMAEKSSHVIHARARASA